MSRLVPHFEDKKELFNYLRLNKELLIQKKKLEAKKSDSFLYIPTPDYFNPEAKKEIGLIQADTTTRLLKVRVVINATNLLDSHGDVHIPGLWKKSLQETKFPLHLQEHDMEFEKVIADATDVTVYTQRMTWKALGYDYIGSSECLKHDSIVRQDRNSFMFDQYQKGWVRNHSVGMRYVNIIFCVNSEEKYWIDEKDNWDKYLPEIVNQQDAIDQGYFWAVTEAKYIEGSAVVKGSCPATPTESCEETEAADSTSDKIEPGNSTQKSETKLFYSNYY